MRGSTRRFSLVLAIVLVVSLATTGLAAVTVHRVEPGDSLHKIATQYGVTVNELKQANGLSGDIIYPGQLLEVPGSRAYTVKAGDTLSGIAAAFGVTLQDLRQANNIWTDLIHPGQVLTVPPPGTVPGADNVIHVVRAGDTLFHLAQRYGTTVTALRQANNIWTDHLSIGQVLVIPRDGGNPSRSTRYTSEELELLARLVYAEAAGEPYLGQVAVAASVLNRVRDPRYPNTVHGVIYQVVNGIYQYSPVMNGRINLAPNQTAYNAAREALSGSDPSRGANGFYNPARTSNQWVRQQPVTVVIGNHVFFRH
ncbi:MAG: LysM peptidoglycan-binding domain-containing protein [Bacillota bacterium]